MLLIDTYDVEAAARKVVALAPKELQEAGITHSWACVLIPAI